MRPPPSGHCNRRRAVGEASSPADRSVSVTRGAPLTCSQRLRRYPLPAEPGACISILGRRPPARAPTRRRHSGVGASRQIFFSQQRTSAMRAEALPDIPTFAVARCARKRCRTFRPSLSSCRDMRRAPGMASAHRTSPGWPLELAKAGLVAHCLSAGLVSMMAAWCAAVGAPSCATAFIAARTASICELIMSVVLRAAST